MRIEIDDIPDTGMNIECEIPREKMQLDIAGVQVELPVKGSIRLRRQGERVEVTGSVSASLELICSRCLETFSREIETSYQLSYLPAPAEAGLSHDVELRPADFAVVYYREPVVDVAQDIRQSVSLAIGVASVCRGDCRGLCPICGCNRNQEECNCRQEKGDPRWGPLGRYRESMRAVKGKE